MSDIPQIIQAALLLLVVFLVGCVIGWLLRTMFLARRAENAEPAATDAVSSRQETDAQPSGPEAANVTGEKPAAAGQLKEVRAVPLAAVETASPVSTSGGQKAAAGKASELRKNADKESTSSKSSNGRSSSKEDGNRQSGNETGQTATVSAQDKPRTLDAPRDGKKDDLKKIKGIGPKLEGVLNDLGIYHFDQIAAWSPREVEWVDDYLSFKGRIGRDDWIGQARELSSK